MKIVINPTWQCQLNCAYCWMRGLGYKPGWECTCRAWAWFVAQLPYPPIVDFSGGDPLLYEGLFPLLARFEETGTPWAITTNLVSDDGIEKLADARFRCCLVVNASAHVGSPADFYARAQRLMDAGYRMALNVVDHPATPELPEGLAVRVSRIPYQAWTEGAATDGARRICDAGMKHVVCSPEGAVYRCAVAMQKGRLALGYISELWDDIRLREPKDCDFGCSTCYTENPGSWEVRMKTLEAVQ